VRKTTVLPLRRRGQRNRPHAGHLRGNDVHQHARDQRRDPAGHVEADPAHRHLAVGHPGAEAQLGRRVLLQLGLAGRPQPPGRLLQPGADVRVEGRQRLVERLGRDPDVGLGDPVVLLGHLEHRLEPAGPDRLADRMHRRDRRLDVEVGARHGVPIVDGPRTGRLRAGRSGASWRRFYEGSDSGRRTRTSAETTTTQIGSSAAGTNASGPRGARRPTRWRRARATEARRRTPARRRPPRRRRRSSPSSAAGSWRCRRS
jgi:hypothetical protein